MVGVSAIGICEGNEHSIIYPEPAIMADYTNLERMMLEAIMSECSQCISSVGHDCMAEGGKTACPFVNVRQACGIDDLQGWR